MGLLDEYGSDSEDESTQSTEIVAPNPTQSSATVVRDTPAVPHTIPQAEPSQPSNATSDSAIPIANESIPEDAPVVGPMRPPSASPSASPEPEDTVDPSLSPYSASRSLIHSLTIPSSIPQLPPSPPGSPKAAIAGKFGHFRSLKYQGVHFNEKLLRTQSLRNPNILQKLMGFVGFDDLDQYATNMAPELWDPKGFKKEAFADELLVSHQKIADARERAKLEQQREQIDFVGSMQQASRSVARESGAVRGDKSGDNSRGSRALPPPRRDERRDFDSRDRRRGDDYRDRRRDDDRDRKRRRSRSRSRERNRGSGRYQDVEHRDRR
ncbi:Similar to Meiotically up-regulated gene 151 protein; acc. no. Q10069 [Pyronema omphalodes CBS 100304]|uniref:Similar to Meiotically up-regulated gene 151 protein acc. no. Q10069 n=1 Tax=Pyronema omphalodes (strain CBS 100304) TaxID=1076935 RepID=U4LLH4_PYROM|nr:Similar to Meiotically up-regulated gene 151 protein; acc. no. Q10069 [Pyronema omphalodes CBS 100304]